MSGRHIIAFDAGGTTIKAAIYDERGRECAVAGEAMAPIQPAPGHLERNPEGMWRAICVAARRVLLASELAPSSIAAVGLTGYGNGLYLVDRNGRPTRNGILSTDQRAQGEIARWRAEGLEEGVIALTYHRLWAGKPLPLIAWLETHEPESLKRAHRALMCKDYLRFRFAGALAAEISDLSSGGLIDQRLRRWTPAVLDHLGLGRYAALLGETLEPLTVAGSVTHEAAAETGLIAGTPVSAGYADGPAMALGLGATDESVISVISGTWGLNQIASSAPITDGSISAPIVGPRPGEFVLTDAGPTSASAFEWFVDSVIGRADRSQGGREALFDWCNEEVSRVRAGDSIPYFLPFLNGRLDRPEARGVFVGLSSWHRLPEMIRAVYEGVAFEHRGHIDHLLKGRPRPRVARFAGGAARSPPWLEIFAAALDLPLELASASELGALGAAIIAAVGAGIHSDLETAVAAMTQVRNRIAPDRALVEVLSRRAATYRALRDALDPVWPML
jgi:L-xylulokinase